MAQLLITVAKDFAERERRAELQINLACRCYTEALHALVFLRRDLVNGHHGSALRCVRPIIEASLRSLCAVYVSSDKDIERESFLPTLKAMALAIEKKTAEVRTYVLTNCWNGKMLRDALYIA